MRYDDIAAAAYKGNNEKMMERHLTAMRNRTTLLRAEQSRAEQSRAEQSRAEQSRAEQSRARDNCALFWLATKLHITFVMDNRRILTG